MEPDEMLAATIIFGQFEGGEFDFGSWRWKERK